MVSKTMAAHGLVNGRGPPSGGRDLVLETINHMFIIYKPSPPSPIRSVWKYKESCSLPP